MMSAKSSCSRTGIDRSETQNAFKNARLGLTDDSLLESIGDVALLFSGHQQQLSRLDGASAKLALLLKSGASFDELVARLIDSGVGSEKAEEWVTSFLNQLAAASVLHSETPPLQIHRQSLELGGARLDLAYSNDRLKETIAPIFAHLEQGAAAPKTVFAIGEFGAGLVQLGRDGHGASLVPGKQLIVRLKGMMLEQALAARPAFAALHAALISDGRHGVLLLGSPGAGKSTLTLALMGSGYRYGSDDVTLINPDGTVTGVALAPGVKEGSWAIADKLGADLTPLPADERPDGQRVRFAKIRSGRLAQPSCQVSKIVSLHRSERPTCELRPMGPEDALAELLRDSRARSGECTIETMSALARLVRNAASFRLAYSEAIEAAELIAADRRR